MADEGEREWRLPGADIPRRLYGVSSAILQPDHVNENYLIERSSLRSD